MGEDIRITTTTFKSSVKLRRRTRFRLWRERRRLDRATRERLDKVGEVFDYVLLHGDERL